MREIVLDTETTGLDVLRDAIVEIGCVELWDKTPTGRAFHAYVNPHRTIALAAVRVHGITLDFLYGKPPFKRVARPLLRFIGDSAIVAHNANFDIGFINNAIRELGLPQIPPERVVDTLQLARKRFPNRANDLDALSRRLRINTSYRVSHGALLDAEILAEVYGELVGERQGSFDLVAYAPESISDYYAAQRIIPLPPRLDEWDIRAHDDFVRSLAQPALWNDYS